MLEIIELLHAMATLAMVAIIWFVQCVHYPLFQFVGAAAFTTYEAAHIQRISWLVAPAMLVELGTALLLAVLGSPRSTAWEVWVGLGLLAVIWGSTSRVVIDNKDGAEGRGGHVAARRLARGNAKANRAPFPGAVSTMSSPPWFATTERQIASPIPTPS